MPISLPDIPTCGNELEDFAAALFQAAGYFVRKQIHEQDFTEILELDAVAIDYRPGRPTSILCEAKSGQWGFPDIFKIVGWMRYLSIDRSAFFVSQDHKKDIAAFAEKVHPLGVTLTHYSDFSKADEIFYSAGFNRVISKKMLNIWRFSAMTERKLYEVLRQYGRGSKPLAGAVSAVEYYRLVNDDLFFIPDVRDQAKTLYEAYMDHPRLSRGIAQEIECGRFDAKEPTGGNSVMSEALREHKHLLVHACWYVEHLARISILKCLVDFHIAVQNGAVPAPGDLRGLKYYSLPQSFRDGFESLRSHKHFKLYPVFWQTFIWGFGGFYLLDRTDQEFQWLAEQTGIPVEEIPNAFKAFDNLFPCGGWLVTAGNTNCRILKMVPACFRGLGARMRLEMYGIKHYDDLGYTNFTAKDMAGWHNAAYATLGGK